MTHRSRWPIWRLITPARSAARQHQEGILSPRLIFATALTLFLNNSQASKAGDPAVPGFMCRILTLNPSGTVLELGTKLWKEKRTDNIVVRACYEQYATRILALLDDPAGGDVLVAGTNGIGKSVFGLHPAHVARWQNSNLPPSRGTHVVHWT